MATKKSSMEINELINRCHTTAKEKGFWDVSQNIAEKLMLCVTELSEACEADRHYEKEQFNEEIADTFIRLFDLCGYLHIDLEKELQRKMNINKGRPYLHGKKY